MSTERPTVVFVPGAFSGGWIWEDNFDAWFAEHGWDTRAVTFPGHGTRGLRRHAYSLDDYVATLSDTLVDLAKPAFVVAHSLGGLVTLRALAEQSNEQKIQGAALLSPIPPDGLIGSLRSMLRSAPISLLKLFAVALEPRVARWGDAPDGIYSDGCEPARMHSVTSRLSTESLRVLTSAGLPRRLSLPQTPLHFFGAQGDRIIPAAEVQRAAGDLAAPCTIFPGMSHTFQAETDYPSVAVAIESWFKSLLSAQRVAA